MSEADQISNENGRNSEFLKLHTVKMKNKMRNVYSSVSHSRSNTIKSERTRFNSVDRQNKTNSTLPRCALQHKHPSLLEDLIPKVRVIQQNKINDQVDLIKQYCVKIFEDNSRQNRMKLAEMLQKLHPFFSKINKTIGEAIVLLSKPKKYYKGQLIYEPLQKLSASQIQPLTRQKQQLGFLLYGKVQLSNDKHFYHHNMKNTGTLFEHIYLGRFDKIEYAVEVRDEAMVSWLPRQSYYIIRRECFLSLDLKYMFAEFENMLKYSLIQKKLLDKEAK